MTDESKVLLIFLFIQYALPLLALYFANKLQDKYQKLIFITLPVRLVLFLYFTFRLLVDLSGSLNGERFFLFLGLAIATIWAILKIEKTKTFNKATFVKQKPSAIEDQHYEEAWSDIENNNEEVVSEKILNTSSNALDTIENELLQEKLILSEEGHKKEIEAEEALLNIWRVGIKELRNEIRDPIPAGLYARRYNISLDEISAQISNGLLVGASAQGELFVEDTPVLSEDGFMKKYSITNYGSYYFYNNYPYDSLKDAVYSARQEEPKNNTHIVNSKAEGQILDIEIFVSMIESDASIDEINQYFSGTTPEAISAFVNTTDACDDYPLHISVKKEKLNILEWLLQHGAKSNTKNYWDETPLDIAVRKENNELQSIIMKNSA